MREGDVHKVQGGASDFATPNLLHVAHELKSPLALIRQLAQLLDTGEYTSAEIEEAARRICLTSERALRLTTDITKTQRLEDALFELEPVNPVSVCEDVVQEMQPLFRESGVKLSTKLRKTSLLAVANRDLLHRILTHFADNAVHYAGSGSEVRFQVVARRDDDVIRVAVRDYGPGISKQIWQQLAHGEVRPQALSWRPHSSGLGLYLSQRFAQSMHATIGAIRHKDGTSFYVDLPSSSQMRLL